MLREDVERSLLATHGEDGYLFPAYDDYCFANVTHTVADLLGVETGRPLPTDVLGDDRPAVGTVLVVLIDGLGLRQWKRDRTDHDLLRAITDRGRVTPLTTVYPSETTAAMTTCHTGSLPAAHGGIGWNIYEPTTGESFEALNFAKKDGTSPAMDFGDVFDASSIYPTLVAGGIDVHHVTAYPRELRGVTTHGFDGLEGVPSTLAEALTAATEPAYVFTYIGAIDAVAHEHGTASTDHAETLAAVCEALQAAIEGVSEDVARETLLLVTADHGHVDTEPDRNVDLSSVAGITDHLATDEEGRPIRFAGNPRNVHLHLKPGTETEVRAAIDAAFDAKVIGREEALARELFGTPPSATFSRRLGDLVVVPRSRSVWWADAEPEQLAYVGMHGGLHPDEMLVPLGAVRLPAIRS